MRQNEYGAIVLSSLREKDGESELVRMLKATPIPDNEILANMGLYLTSKNLSRLLFFYEIYKKIITKHGVIFEFGVRWGQTLSLMSALRGMFEPYNRHRKIVGFDTFSGFKGIEPKDGKLCKCKNGSFSVPAGYEEDIEKILSIQEKLDPAGHIKKYELVKGDATKSILAYLKEHPETLVSLAVFDFDIYRPTRKALEAIEPHLYKGSILVFDELCDVYFPGETIAVREVLGLKNLRIQRMPMTARLSYVEME